MSEDTILNCLHCGNDGKDNHYKLHLVWSEDEYGYREWAVQCSCGMRTDWFEDKQKALDVWNNRNLTEKEEIDIELTDETFMTIATEAHERDITFNDMVNMILRERMNG